MYIYTYGTRYVHYKSKIKVIYDEGVGWPSLHPDILFFAALFALIFTLAVIKADGGLNREVLQQSLAVTIQMIV